MEISPANLLARIMKIENLLFGNNGEVPHKFSYIGNIITQSGAIAGYCMRPDGVNVDVYGCFNSNPTPGTSVIANSTQLFTLPTGYRPPASVFIPCNCFPTNGTGEGFITIGSNGVATYSGPTGSPTAILFNGVVPLLAPV